MVHEQTAGVCAKGDKYRYAWSTEIHTYQLVIYSKSLLELKLYQPSLRTATELKAQGAGSLLVPRINKVTSGGRAFSYKAPQLWNNLPVSVRDSDTAPNFKSRLKTYYLFSRAFGNQFPC